MFSVLKNITTDYNNHYCYAYIWSVECKYAQ